MIFWCSGSGLAFDYPFKLIPWYRRPEGGASLWMIDSGVRAEPPTVDELVDAQVKYADVAVNPDVLGDPVFTMLRTAEWIEKIKKRKPWCRLVICTQGNIQERLLQVDTFPDADAYGIGMFQEYPGIPWTQEGREKALREFVPAVHARGKAVHIFGIGCTKTHMTLFRELKVDSFDSSAAIRAAVCGKILNSSLKQIHVGGGTNADTKRIRLYLNLSQVRHAIINGFPGDEEDPAPPK